MPAEGGVPKRLTYTATLGRDEVSDRMGPNNIVMGWTPDGKNILFRSRMRSFNDFIGQLYTVPVDGGLPEQLPLPRGGFARYLARRQASSPTTASSASSAPGSAIAAAWPTTSGSTTSRPRRPSNSPNDPAQDIIPMWVGGEDLLPLRPRTEQAVQPVLDRSRDEEDRAAHRLHGLRHQVPVARRQGDRLRERRLHLHAST